MKNRLFLLLGTVGCVFGMYHGSVLGSSERTTDRFNPNTSRGRPVMNIITINNSSLELNVQENSLIVPHSMGRNERSERPAKWNCRTAHENMKRDWKRYQQSLDLRFTELQQTVMESIPGEHDLKQQINKLEKCLYPKIMHIQTVTESHNDALGGLNDCVQELYLRVQELQKQVDEQRKQLIAQNNKINDLSLKYATLARQYHEEKSDVKKPTCVIAELKTKMSTNVMDSDERESNKEASDANYDEERKKNRSNDEKTNTAPGVSAGIDANAEPEDSNDAESTVEAKDLEKKKDKNARKLLRQLRSSLNKSAKRVSVQPVQNATDNDADGQS